jgi:hypothetical protein
MMNDELKELVFIHHSSFNIHHLFFGVSHASMAAHNYSSDLFQHVHDIRMVLPSEKIFLAAGYGDSAVMGHGFF